MIFGDKMCNGTFASDPFAFSTLHLLRTYNRILKPTAMPTAQYYGNLALLKDPLCERGSLSFAPVQTLSAFETLLQHHHGGGIGGIGGINTNGATISCDNRKGNQSPDIMAAGIYLSPQSDDTTSSHRLHSKSCRLTPENQYRANTNTNTANDEIIVSNHAATPMAGDINYGAATTLAGLLRRQRGEKRPIPDEQKDDKYYERRKRNNEAAKKSRDARKIREDRIALRAAMLEQENGLMRAQLLAAREEISTLRQMLCTRRHPSLSAATTPLTVTI